MRAATQLPEITFGNRSTPAVRLKTTNPAEKLQKNGIFTFSLNQFGVPCALTKLRRFLGLNKKFHVSLFSHIL